MSKRVSGARHANTLDAERAALVVIDMQESFRNAVPDFSEVAALIAQFAHGAQLLGVPLIVTEQYPKGLGHTAGEIRTVLPPGFEPVEKTAFSSCGAREFLARLDETGARQVLLCGIEAHICVNQTAHDLVARGVQVHLLIDCIAARTEHNRQIGLAKMQQAGALPSSVETALFELMRDAKHEQFRAIQKLIK
ncbi:MAG: hydrolase [Acidobacteria bacterium]|nr:hydrolase [Acidobacteriota bacterium]MCA1643547.1 hydrolase [Acidobacteriota bacterium]